jgi:hypothetical protein
MLLLPFSAGFASGELQRRHKLPSDLLVYDLQYLPALPHVPAQEGDAHHPVGRRADAIKERARHWPPSHHRRGDVPERVRI